MQEVKPINKKSLKLSKQNDDSRYFTVKGILFEMVGTKINSNGSYTVTIKNTTMKGFNAYKEVGAEKLDQILKQYGA